MPGRLAPYRVLRNPRIDLAIEFLDPPLRGEPWCPVEVMQVKPPQKRLVRRAPISGVAYIELFVEEAATAASKVTADFVGRRSHSKARHNPIAAWWRIRPST